MSERSQFIWGTNRHFKNINISEVKRSKKKKKKKKKKKNDNEVYSKLITIWDEAKKMEANSTATTISGSQSD